LTKKIKIAIQGAKKLVESGTKRAITPAEPQLRSRKDSKKQNAPDL